MPSLSGVLAVVRSVSRPSPSSLASLGSRLGARLRPATDTVDATLAVAALGVGTGIVAGAAYAAADAVLPLALLRGLVGTITP